MNSSDERERERNLKTYRVKCIVPMCGARAHKCSMKFFKFPKDAHRASLWIESIGLANKDIETKYNFVCEQHFEKKYIGAHKLTLNAIPELNISRETKSLTDATCSTGHPYADDYTANTSTIVYPEVSRTRTFMSIDTQTDPDVVGQQNEFLELINKITCHHCESKCNSDFNCSNCKNNVRNVNIFKSKLLKAKTEFKLLNLEKRRIQRNFNMLKRKYNKIKRSTIDETIDNLPTVNTATKNICKLLLKQDYFYNNDDKLFAQSLYYKSAAAYKYLRNTLSLKLPSLSSIYNWSPIQFIPAGVNEILILKIKNIFEAIPEESRLCVLSFDEIKIKKDLTFNTLTGKIDGFCDDGIVRKKECATSALFFLIKSITGGWKHVLGYVLLNESMNAEELAKLIRTYISICDDRLNLKVLMVTCDQAATNLAAFKRLGILPDKPFFFCNNKKVFAQFDAPHLLKSARNALLSNQIKHSEQGIIDSNVIRRIFENEKHQKIKLIPKLNNSHINPNTFQKMNVKLAVQFLSNTVACAIRSTLKVSPATFGPYLKNAIPTANLVERFNNIFDCLNCRNFSSKNPYEQPLRKDNNTFNYLVESLVYLKNLKVISPNENYFKFLKGLELTINSQLMLIEYLGENFGIDYILTGKTNQDALENFFSILRGKGGYNYTPTSHDIGIHFANVISTKILFNSPVSNCIIDESENLAINWDILRNDYKESLKTPRTDEYNDGDKIESILRTTNIPELKGNAIIYFAGYCAYKTISCEKCTELLLKNEEEPNISVTETFLHQKNFKKDVSNFGALKAPNELFENIARIIVQIFELSYQAECHYSNICQNIIDKCMSRIRALHPMVEEHFECIGHIQKLVSFFILVLLRKNCKWSVTNNEFQKPQKRSKNAKPSSAASKKLKILNT